MSVTTTLSQINSINSKFASIFAHLDSLFPELLTKNKHTAFYQLQNTISTISAAVSSSKTTENLATFGEKYTPVFTKLNEKITDLNSLDKMISEIKEDSEQMELIALNAMVISVKSGEKGLAFSKITENLQRLSKDMFVYSDKLSGEESELLEQINSLKTIFSGILDAQKSISAKDSECSSEMKSLVSSVSPSLSDLERESAGIYLPIEETRDSLKQKSKLQEGFKQLSGYLSDLEYSADVSPQNPVYIKIQSSFSEISQLISQICQNFATKWSDVIEILDKSDGSRMDFENRFLNKHAFGNDNIEKQLDLIVQKFQIISGEFSKYNMVQKNLQATCEGITAKAKSIYSVFENLRPVMSRLHHVRILQQIEVSKNDAIKSVQDSVTDMDNLINAANASLDQMEGLLESFIHDTGSMLSNFVLSIQRDNTEMETLRNEKEVCLGDLTNSQGILASESQNFSFFPDGFQSKCVLVQQSLQELMRLNSEFMQIANDFEQ